MTLALSEGLRSFRSPNSCSLSATVATIAHLESSPLTNAGLGSNLTLDGSVECEAALMDASSGSFGAVGSLRGIANPVVAARHVLEAGGHEGDCGRINPLILVGSGASNWCRGRHGVVECEPDALVTDAARRRRQRHLQYVEDATRQRESSSGKQTRKRSASPNATKVLVMKRRHLADHDNAPPKDTVGAIAMSADGHVTSGVSSGGISLKLPGRLGSAAQYGAGTFAKTRGNVSVACSASGTGEQIIKTLFARECVSRVLAADDPALALRAAIEDFLDEPWLGMYQDRHVGVIVFRSEALQKQAGKPAQIRRELWWAHTTESFAIGWAAKNGGKPHVRISTLPTGRRFKIEGTRA
ncbi:taspase, threonine aspartase, 1 [Thoreauomyces humboldtii]|nr:taspase, threonine aspartase, 1 [Thoreauomyces humboldtii]